MKKIIYISHNIFGYKLLKYLKNITNDKNIYISLVITRKNTKHLSDQCFKYDNFCNKHNIKLLKTNFLDTDDKIISEIKLINSDYIFVFGWSQIISKNIINSCKYCIGSHPTMLPKYKGNSAIPWQILLEEKKGGVSLFILDELVDNGKIIFQGEHNIDNFESSTSLYFKCIETTKKILEKNIDNIINENITEIHRNEIDEIFLDNRRPIDSLINWKKSNKYIEKLIRAQSYPYPQAFSYICIKNNIIKVDILDVELDSINYISVPGNIIFHNEKIYVNCGKGFLKIKKIRVNNNILDPIKYFKYGQRFANYIKNIV